MKKAKNPPVIVIAGTGSGVGKTSFTVGLCAALKYRGLAVQPCKVGPDFIDPTWLSKAAGQVCYSLDGWMSGRQWVERIIQDECSAADVIVIEGVMGMYDGSSAESISGSTAEIAAWLGAPVLLLVNAHGSARSIAAVVQGFNRFEKKPGVSGVIANHCGSPAHADYIKRALTAAGGPPLVHPHGLQLEILLLRLKLDIC